MPYLTKMRLSLQETDPLNPQVPVGDPVEIQAGQQLPDWTPTATLNALVNAGAVVFAADPQAAEVVVVEVPAQPRTPDQPVILPSDPNGTAPVLGGLVGDDAGTVPVTESPAVVETERPEARANKDEWERYATSPAVGMTQAEAESMTKAALIAEVTRRENLAGDNQ